MTDYKQRCKGIVPQVIAQVPIQATMKEEEEDDEDDEEN